MGTAEDRLRGAASARRLEGKVAIVTGAAGGIGAACARAFAAEGASLLLEDFKRVIEVNAVGVFLGMRAVAPSMSEQRSGSIVNVSSVALPSQA